VPTKANKNRQPVCRGYRVKISNKHKRNRACTENKRVNAD